MSHTNKLILLRWLIIIFVVAVIVLGFLIYRQSTKKNEFKTVNNPQKAKEVAKTLKEIVGKIYVLPSEDPFVATVTDTNVLPKEPFYKNAQNGDKVLIFPIAHKAILYRPGINKVVDVGEAAPNQNPGKDVAGAKAVIEVKNQNATGGGTIKTQPKILFQSGQ